MNKIITLSLVALMSVSAFASEFPKEISQYLNFQESLSSDQELSSKELETFLGNVKKLNNKQLSDAVEGLTTAKGIKEQRNAFALVSNSIIEHAKKEHNTAITPESELGRIIRKFVRHLGEV